ncbi:hypothetical protein BDV29DRAFT_169474 [Aspergillus leporis]|uniref:Uncharacterized protein n=1 Tax=Aspergillus leporis TaxID=41062 RepID=A0A5N5XBR6_9EURO|nr:hypothetical protein BDV29DRAFT_169474 [Aspergillus leporis]
MRALRLVSVLFPLAASAVPIDGNEASTTSIRAPPEFTYEGDIAELPPPKPVETSYFLENGEQVPDISHFPPPPSSDPKENEDQTKPANDFGGGGLLGAGGTAAGTLLGAGGSAAGTILGAGGSAVGTTLGAGGSAAGRVLGTGAAAGSPGTPGNAGTAGNTGQPSNAGTIGTAGAAGVDAASGYGTFEGDVSELPPPKKPVETYFDENGQEIPGPEGGERTFSLDVHGEGEGALSEGGNPGRGGRPGPSRQSGSQQPGFSQPRGIDLNDFRESDKSIGRLYLQTKDSPHVKPFDGGRTAEERQLFTDIRNEYTNLKEVKATSNRESNFAARDRGRYRYIAGTKDGKEVLVGVAEHGTNNNNFVNFTRFPRPQ